MSQKKLEFKVNPLILDEIIKIADDLPERAIRETVKGGATAYDHPAGLALLGMKDALVDTVINLKMSGGCWDAPNINFDDMDKGFRELIDTERMCVGMALVRHPDWQPEPNRDSGKIPNDLRVQIHGMRNSFTDITKTIWLIAQNNYFRVYRPTKGQDGRVNIKEIPVKTLFTEDNSEMKLLAEKLKRDRTARQKKLDAIREAKEEKKRAEIRKQEAAVEEKKRLSILEEKEKNRVLAVKKRQEDLNRRLKEAKEAIIESSPGYVFVKTKKGDYVLCAV